MIRLTSRERRSGASWHLAGVVAASFLALTGCESGQSVKPAGAVQTAPPAVGRTEPAEATAVTRPNPAPEVTIPRGTALRVRLNHAISTSASRPGDRFTATLDEPLVIDGRTLFPRGAEVQGSIRESDDSGRLRGRAVLALSLESVALRGRSYPIRTQVYRRVSADHRKRNSVLVGGGSGVGALLGGIAGGGRGALIGAGAGAAAGTAGAAATGKRVIRLPAESVIGFRLLEPIRIEG